MYSRLISLLAIFSLGVAHPETGPRLPSAWYHPEDHPVRLLFKRQATTPGAPALTAPFPNTYTPPLPENITPAAWTQALHAAEQSGLIPNITVSTNTNDGNPTYGGQDPAGPEICSSTYQCRAPGDIWDAPNGTIGISFDDGPADGSAILYDFLEEKNQSATHFMIGINILNGQDLFMRAFSELQNDIAVHTWTHPYMTTQNNTQVVAQLGWTLQIIHDLTGGRVARYWRPPYGDSDNRVRAIAQHVFGLTQVDWNQDSEDWSITEGATTEAAVQKAISGWYAGPKSPGLIILEHELYNNTATAFIDTYPTLVSNSWKAISLAQLFDGPYQNTDDDTSPVNSMDIAGPVPSVTPSPGSSTGGSSSSSSSSPSSSATSSNNNNKDISKHNHAAHARPSFLILVSAILGTIAMW